MRYLTLYSLFIAFSLNAYSQDTICTMIQPDRVIVFNYYTNNVINMAPTEGSYFINVREGEILVLHLYDKIDALRDIITTFPDNSQLNDTFNSKSNIYYSPLGPVIVEIKKPRILKI